MGLYSILNAFIFALVLSCRANFIAGYPQLDFINDQRIGGGRVARPGEIPYQLSLHKWGQPLPSCGALHCVDNISAEDITLVAGDLDLRDTTGWEQYRRVVYVLIHEDYSNSLKGSDLALLFITHAFRLNYYVKTIALPSQYKESHGNLVVSGWGTFYGGGPSSDKLQVVRMPVVDHEICREQWRYHPEFPTNIDDGMLCSGVPTGELSPCDGDSSGPVRSRNKCLVGIVSFGDPSCQHPDYPAVFTKVSNFVNWINYQVIRYMQKETSEKVIFI